MKNNFYSSYITIYAFYKLLALFLYYIYCYGNIFSNNFEVHFVRYTSGEIRGAFIFSYLIFISLGAVLLGLLASRPQNLFYLAISMIELSIYIAVIEIIFIYMIIYITPSNKAHFYETPEPSNDKGLFLGIALVLPVGIEWFLLNSAIVIKFFFEKSKILI